MNKAELISKVAQKTGFSRKDSDSAVNAALSIITETLAAGERVQLVGFGSFEVKERKSHMGHNPATNEPMEISATNYVSFKPGKALNDAIK